jgi:rubrerythrin
MGWHDERFIYDPKKINVVCKVCGINMYFPKSKADKYKTCGGECLRTFREKTKEEKNNNNKRDCIKCGKHFIARTWQIENGNGKFCSKQCALRYISEKETPEQRSARGVKTSITMRNKIDRGEIKYRRKENHPNWKGGNTDRHAKRKRDIASGAYAKYLREYREKNKAKVLEWGQNRRARKQGNKLPRGTVKEIGDNQKWKCAICRSDVKEKFHIDHIYPLSKGGEHKKENIQILCPLCNVKKASKDPIDYMQQVGYLI